jgi:hypothetical protein
MLVRTKRGAAFLLNLAVLVFTAAAAQDPAAQPVVDIRFFDKRVYFFDDSPIFVEVKITNNTAQPWRFSMAQDREFSVDFEMRQLSSRIVPPAESILRRRSSDMRVFFRDITLTPGETFAFTEDLKSYCQIETPGSYIVQAKFYPNLINTAAGHPLLSNRLNLNVRKRPATGPQGIPELLDVDTGAALVRVKLPPDEVVSYTLDARQHAQWEKFFLYLDTEQLMMRDGARNRQWRAESEEGRQRMLARYREDLKAARIDENISAVPTEFKIEQTTYNANQGTVVVTERFKVGGYTEIKRYTYYLTLAEGVWTINDYNVLNIGIE